VIEASIAFLFGLLIGSCLNVCIYRWPRDLSVVRPRSHCPSCQKTIAWYDNIPVASYLRLGGKCRACGARISPRYPAVELITGLLFGYFVWYVGPTALAVKICVFCAMLVALVFTDFEERILPDEFTLGGTLAGLIFAGFVPLRDPTAMAVLWLVGVESSERLMWIFSAAFGAAFPALLLWFGGWIYFKLRKREGLGFGDVKLTAMIGAFLGLEGALLALVVASLLGSLLGYLYIKLTGKDMATYELPFGGFLGASAIAMAIFGKQLLNWYGNL
jgi:leader peptidase (prepilin peptidase)/N-methyltransferase